MRHLLLIALALLLVPVSAAPQSAGTSGQLARLEQAVPRGFKGVVLVANRERILLHRAYGRAGRRGIYPQSRFWIASTGKQFTGAAIMKLVDEGRLRLDDPLRRFFPEAPAEKAGITLLQLLTHNSGYGQSYVSELQPDRASAVKAMLAERLAGAPGSGFRYANSNIQLAAAIVEVTSGLSYPDFVRQKLWEPAGLRQTGFAGSRDAAWVLPIEGALPARLQRRYWGEQGVYSSAADLYRWYRALEDNKIIKPMTRLDMFQRIAKTSEGYATIGWFSGETPRRSKFIFIRGNEDFGANSLVYFYPTDGIVIIVLSHAGQADGDTSWSRKVHRALEAQLGL